ncbi:MAG TPA: fatty acid desaturase, partial [bacterium]|nr:fatty acid desaturase [bacterium]
FADVEAPPPSLTSYIRPEVKRSLWQLINTAGPFALLWYATYRSLEYSYWLTLLLAVPTGAFLVRLFIFQHDCGHGSFFPKQSWNNFLGTILGVLTFTPYDYWRRTHAIHHATSGNLDRRDFGDVTTLTVAEYRELSRWRRLGYRVYRHPLTLFVVGPAYQFLLKHRLPLDMPWSWKREWRSVMLTNALIIGLAVAAAALIGWSALLKVQLPVILIAGTLGVWLFYIQHQFEDTYWREEPEWNYREASLRGSSYYDLPPALNWLTGNIGVHHVHHLCSRIPNYRLHQALAENEFLQKNVTRLTLRDSLRCVGFKLWDEETRQMVGFDER